MIRGDNGLAFMLRYENVAWFTGDSVRILDRRIYPVKTEFVTCRTHYEVAKAIADMVTQSGGPYIAAGMGMALACREAMAEKEPMAYLEKAAYTLSHARPTTSAEMQKVTGACLKTAFTAFEAGRDPAEAVFNHTISKLEEKYMIAHKTGEYLADLIPMGGSVMTQCFAETVVGTLVRSLKARNNPVKFFCPETRPYFQGSRLTASVICDMGYDVTVITDNMPGYTLKQKNIDVFTSASDVITMDGHIVNKVGTFQISLAANYYGIPYYCTGLPDKAHPTMDSVTIEQRDPSLVLEAMGTRVSMEGVKGYYPAFDVTPPELTTGIITDKGIYKPSELSRYFE